MTLQEAINSGKRFRRKGWTVVITADPTYWLQSGRTLHLSTADILADDWEIEEVRVTITYSEFDAAWMEAVRKNKTFEGLVQQIEFRRLVAKELGL